jgi:hypothetical protein
MRKLFIVSLLIIFLASLASCIEKEKLDPIEEIQDGQSKGDLLVKLVDDYYRDFGKHPEHLDNLVPAYISEIPKTLSGKEFSFEQIEGDIYYLSFPVTNKELRTICSYIKRLERWDCSVFLE